MSPLSDHLTTAEADARLDQPEQFCARAEVLDWLDGLPLSAVEASLQRRVQALQARLEACDEALYATIRDDVRRGAGGTVLRQWARRVAEDEGAAARFDDDGYDMLDALLAGVLAFDAPEADGEAPGEDLVFYQPTPARHIFDLIERTALDADDVLIDFGAGLGHVPLLAAICTPARTIGVELQAALVDGASRCAQALGVTRTRFLQQDVRMTDLSVGTVFYLYTPFRGAVLRTVLDQLRAQAQRRPIRVCSYGPCTAEVAAEPWLQTSMPVQAGRVAIFRSR